MPSSVYHTLKIAFIIIPYTKNRLEDYLALKLFVLFFIILQGFVMAVTMMREAGDEVRRYTRDKEMNSQLYSKLTMRGNDLFFYFSSI